MPSIISIVFFKFYIKNKRSQTSTDGRSSLEENIRNKTAQIANQHFDYKKYAQKIYRDMCGVIKFIKIGAYSDEFGTRCSLRESWVRMLIIYKFNKHIVVTSIQK